MSRTIVVIMNHLCADIIFLLSYFRFHSIWKYKQYLYKRKQTMFMLKKHHIAAYDKRVFKKGGGWIGYNAVFKNTPFFPHGISGVFISGGSEIGRDCVIYQQVTIGSNTIKDSPYFGSPIIGDNVLIGAGAKIIGKVQVGDNVRIGANAVVVRDVPNNSVVVSTGRVIKKEGKLDNRFYSFSESLGKFGYYQDGQFVIDE